MDEATKQALHDAEDASLPDPIAVLRKLDEIDCCTGYAIQDADYPKFWDALGMSRTILKKTPGLAPCRPSTPD